MPDHITGSELHWWHDTLTRLSARCQHASTALAAIPALIGHARARPGQPGPAHALARAIDAARTHLDRITAYTDALADPGPAICTTASPASASSSATTTGSTGAHQHQPASDIPGDRIENTTSRNPDSVSKVNMTPEEARSERTCSSRRSTASP